MFSSTQHHQNMSKPPCVGASSMDLIELPTPQTLSTQPDFCILPKLSNMTSTCNTHTDNDDNSSYRMNAKPKDTIWLERISKTRLTQPNTPYHLQTETTQPNSTLIQSHNHTAQKPTVVLTTQLLTVLEITIVPLTTENLHCRPSTIRPAYDHPKPTHWTWTTSNPPPDMSPHQKCESFASC